LQEVEVRAEKLPFAVTLLAITLSTMVAAENPPPIPNGTALTRGCRNGINPLDKINPSWVSVSPNDTPRVAEGIVRESHVSTNDNPAFHVSHDWNGDVLLEPSYTGLNSDGNHKVDGEQLMEIEWESTFFPSSFWPVPGDKAWILGRWIFDCGHPDPYRTEIHPPKAVAFTRAEPVIFPSDQRPSNSNLTQLFIQGHGGYYHSRAVGQNYVFEVPLPPKPGLPSTLRTAVLSLPFGGPRPTFTLLPQTNKLQITYPLRNVFDVLNTKKFGAVIATAWQSIAVNQKKPGYRLLRVTFDSVKINTDHDDLFSGEWRLWVRANSHWLEIPKPSLDDVDDGQTVAISRSVDLIVPDNGTLEIETTGWEDDCDFAFRSSEMNIHLWDAGLKDLACEVNGNQDIGTVREEYDASNLFGVGSAKNALSKRNGAADTSGDFNLRYHITMLKRFEPQSGGVLSPSAPNN
jgi:hypothetical protein